MCLFLWVFQILYSCWVPFRNSIMCLEKLCSFKKICLEIFALILFAWFLSGLKTRSYVKLLIKQLKRVIVCLFCKLFFGVSVRMNYAKPRCQFPFPKLLALRFLWGNPNPWNILSRQGELRREYINTID